MKIDLITVSRNNYEELFQTIESIGVVLNNNSNDSSIGGLIVVDASTNTKNINNELLEFEKTFRIKTMLIQEPDNGIYDGMNKGVKYSSNEFVQFINSGDKLINFISTQDLRRTINQKNVAGIATDVNLVFNKKTIKRKARTICQSKGISMPAIHQGIVYKQHLLTKVPFSLNYKVCGDFDNICHLLSLNFQFLVINKTTASLTVGGISTTKPFLLFSESTDIYKKYMLPRWWEVKLYRLRLLKSIILYQLLYQLNRI